MPVCPRALGSLGGGGGGDSRQGTPLSLSSGPWLARVGGCVCPVLRAPAAGHGWHVGGGGGGDTGSKGPPPRELQWTAGQSWFALRQFTRPGSTMQRMDSSLNPVEAMHIDELDSFCQRP